MENTYDREFDVVPSRLRRPGAVVLEIDDEIRPSSILTTRPTRAITAGTGTCRELPASNGSATDVPTGSLLAIRGYGATGSATRSRRESQGFESL